MFYYYYHILLIFKTVFSYFNISGIGLVLQSLSQFIWECFFFSFLVYKITVHLIIAGVLDYRKYGDSILPVAFL